MTLLVVLSIVLLLLRAMPVEGYFTQYDKVSQEQIDVTLQQLGLKDPAPSQIARYISMLLRGDLGISTKYRMGYPVSAIIAQKAPVSVRLGMISFCISIILGFFLGIAMSERKTARVSGTILIVVVMAVPSSVCHLLIQLYGTQILHLPMLYDKSNAASMILPVFSLAQGNIVFYAMWLYRYIRDEASKDYARYAQAKGASMRSVMRVHVFRNAVIPLVQYIPGSILFTVTGSLYVESLYSVPGMGGMLIQAIKLQDNALVQALVVIYTLISASALLLGDLLMAALDPRIQLAEK